MKKKEKIILKKELENSNWRLINDSMNYWLGFLSGRLRAYEIEDDLLKLAK